MDVVEFMWNERWRFSEYIMAGEAGEEALSSTNVKKIFFLLNCSITCSWHYQMYLTDFNDHRYHKKNERIVKYVQA